MASVQRARGAVEGIVIQQVFESGRGQRRGLAASARLPFVAGPRLGRAPRGGGWRVAGGRWVGGAQRGRGPPRPGVGAAGQCVRAWPDGAGRLVEAGRAWPGELGCACDWRRPRVGVGVGVAPRERSLVSCRLVSSGLVSCRVVPRRPGPSVLPGGSKCIQVGGEFYGAGKLEEPGGGGKSKARGGVGGPGGLKTVARARGPPAPAPVSVARPGPPTAAAAASGQPRAGGRAEPPSLPPSPPRAEVTPGRPRSPASPRCTR